MFSYSILYPLVNIFSLQHIDVIHTHRRWLYDLCIFYDGYMTMLFYTQGVPDLNDQTSPIYSMSKSK